MTSIPQSVIVHPADTLGGALDVPGDKSVSHRMAMVAGLASGTSTIRNFLQSEDTLCTLRAMEALGARTFEVPLSDDAQRSAFTSEAHCERASGGLLEPVAGVHRRRLTADAQGPRDESECAADFQPDGAATLVPRDDAPEARAVGSPGKRAVVNRHDVEALRAQARNTLQPIPDGPSGCRAHGERRAQLRDVFWRS